MEVSRHLQPKVKFKLQRKKQTQLHFLRTLRQRIGVIRQGEAERRHDVIARVLLVLIDVVLQHDVLRWNVVGAQRGHEVLVRQATITVLVPLREQRLDVWRWKHG